LGHIDFCRDWKNIPLRRIELIRDKAGFVGIRRYDEHNFPNGQMSPTAAFREQAENRDVKTVKWMCGAPRFCFCYIKAGVLFLRRALSSTAPKFWLL